MSNKKYFNKCNFLSEEAKSILELNISKNKTIEIIKIIKKIETNLTKNKNKVCFKKKQKMLKEILSKTKKQLEKKDMTPNNWSSKSKTYTKVIKPSPILLLKIKNTKT